jgi:hypothetical protein
MDAPLMAVWRRGRPKELLHHSDQGSQYTSEDFQRLLSAQGIVCSMSRRGDCWDNAAMESFFSTLKTERVSRSHYATREEARADIFDYIERFYNPKRRHSTLGQVSPIEFERRQLSLQSVRENGGSSLCAARLRVPGCGCRKGHRGNSLGGWGNSPESYPQLLPASVTAYRTRWPTVESRSQ